MLRFIFGGATVAALLAAALPSSAMARSWTLEDMLTVPELRSIAVDVEGRSALYVTRAADMSSNRTLSSLHLVDLKSGASRQLLQAGWIDDLRRIPGTASWSARMDRGEGVQLYRISRQGKIDPLLVYPANAVFGDTDGGLLTANSHAPLKVGIQAYSWSPDGTWLWYVGLDAEAAKPAILFDDGVAAERGRRRTAGRATVNLYLRGRDGKTILVARRPSSDRVALHYGHDVIWTANGVRFRLEDVDEAGRSAFITMAWSFADRRATKVDSRETFSYWLLAGPHGGELVAEGLGDTREIVEHQAGGGRYSYGRHPFTIGDGRGTGAWLSDDGTRAIVGTRTILNPLYGLALVDQRRLRVIKGDLSLVRCDFTPKLDTGACLAEAQAVPPAIVAVDVRSRTVRRVASLSPRHDAITPLTIMPRLWINRHGDKSTGYVILPRDYRKDRRYPAVLVTHSGDADERFANQGNQWEYPVQLLAERGYVVLLVNDPMSRQNADFAAAWASTPAIAPERIREMRWLRSVDTFEDAVRQLAAEGIVDANRVGIAGYSRGAQVTNVAMTQSALFRAASSGDAGVLEPEGYGVDSAYYDLIFGGSPYGEALPSYRSFSPSLRADRVCGAILQQNAKPLPGSIDLYRALRNSHVPAQITLYPGEDVRTDETHIFHIPANRAAAMQENIAWFDYWLLDKRDSKSPSAGRYPEWDKMRGQIPARCKIEQRG